MENLSGHEYIAVLLPADVAFMQFNVSVLGKIDLDDTDHVIASDHLFDVAKKAGTFVGDEEENIIDYRASFNDYMMESTDDEDWDEAWKAHVQERLAAGLNFLEGTDKWTVTMQDATNKITFNVVRRYWNERLNFLRKKVLTA